MVSVPLLPADGFPEYQLLFASRSIRYSSARLLPTDGLMASRSIRYCSARLLPTDGFPGVSGILPLGSFPSKNLFLVFLSRFGKIK